MVAGAAGHNVEFLKVTDVLGGEVEVLKEHLAVPNPGRDAPAQGLGLLHDLLEHEVLIAALLRRVHLPVHLNNFLVHRLHQMVIALDAILGENGQLPILHVAHLAGVAENGGDVAGQEGAALSIAQDEGAVFAYGNQLVGAVVTQDAQSIGALNAVKHPAHGLEQVPLIEVLDELGDDLRVRL